MFAARLRLFAEPRNDAPATISVVGVVGRSRIELGGPKRWGPNQSPGWGLPIGSGAKERALDDPFSNMRDPARRAERYRKVAVEYYDLAKEASSPSLRAYFQRIAEEYRLRAQGELRVLEHEGAAATARSAT